MFIHHKLTEGHLVWDKPFRQMEHTSDEEFECLAKQDHKKTRLEPTAHELAQMFPEAKPAVKRLLKEWKKKIGKLTTARYQVKAIAHKYCGDDYEKELFFCECLEALYIDGPIEDLQEKIKKYKLILYFMEMPKDKKGRGDIIKERIAEAKQVPISEFIKFKGGTALCLWHPDRHPSMHYYEKDNRVKCFSCGKHEDVIGTVMQLHNLAFLEAVSFITNKK